jgi:spartin
MDYDHGYEAAPPTSHSDQASYYNRSGDHYERYESDERYSSKYAVQPSYSRHGSYEETPHGYLNYGEQCDDGYERGLFHTTSNAYDFRAVTTTAVTEPALAANTVVTETSEDVLVNLRGAMVHLVDDQESPLLAEGEFSVVRIEQEGNGIVAIVRVGERLQWPLTKDEPAVKLDSSHYFFTIRVPRRVDDMDRETAGGGSQECLTYGVTFTGVGQERQLRELDGILEQYCGFSTPQLAHGDGSERDEFDGAFGYGHGNGHNRVPSGRIVPDNVVSSHGKRVSEKQESEFWRTMAPNVDEYNSEVAKTMAKGTGSIIKGIFWLRDSTLAQLENSSTYVRGQMKPNPKPSSISPRTLRNLKRVRNMTVATEQVAKSVLEGVAKAAGFFSGALMASPAGKKFFQLLPGEVALVSMDAFAKLFDAVEKAGTDVMQSTAMFTQDVVAHRYGEDAGQVTENTLSTAGHVFATAWTVSKVRSALNPAKFRPSKTGMLKAAAKAVVAGGRSNK